MPEQHARQGKPAGKWDDLRIQVALATAHQEARRFARRRGLGRADREDLTQDILLAIVEASHRYDPARGRWSAFVGTLARHVVIDHVRRAPAPPCVPLDPNDSIAAAIGSPDLAIDLCRAALDLPPGPLALLRIVVAHGDVADARRAVAQPSTSFYRALGDLRCWLRTCGLHPAAPTTRRAHAVPWE